MSYTNIGTYGAASPYSDEYIAKISGEMDYTVRVLRSFANKLAAEGSEQAASLSAQLTTLDSVQRGYVFAGLWSYEQWKTRAEEIRSGLRVVSSNTGETVLQQLSTAVDSTVETVKQVAKNAAAALPELPDTFDIKMILGLVLGILFLFLVLRIV